MAWQKSPPELIEQFASSLPDDPAVERRQMFGFPVAFANGNMFAGLHESQMFVRLPKEQYDELLAEPGAGPFEIMPGRPMKDYAVLPETIRSDTPGLRAWLARAFAHALSLPPKERKPRPRTRGRNLI
jgi:TfoX/Sxy family transcriptional regulator of competence genes